MSWASKYHPGPETEERERGLQEGGLCVMIYAGFTVEELDLRIYAESRQPALDSMMSPET